MHQQLIGKVYSIGKLYPSFDDDDLDPSYTQDTFILDYYPPLSLLHLIFLAEDKSTFPPHHKTTSGPHLLTPRRFSSFHLAGH